MWSSIRSTSPTSRGYDATSKRLRSRHRHTWIADDGTGFGRWGFQSFGVPVAGAMDARAHRIANALVGNHADAATLEVTLTGPDIEFEDARVVAVSGAIFDLMLDSNPVLMNAPFEVTPGSRLTFGPRSAGARACVAISGGIDVPKVFGSRATHVASRMGGLDGRPLAAGRSVACGRVEPGATRTSSAGVAAVADRTRASSRATRAATRPIYGRRDRGSAVGSLSDSERLGSHGHQARRPRPTA